MPNTDNMSFEILPLVDDPVEAIKAFFNQRASKTTNFPVEAGKAYMLGLIAINDQAPDNVTLKHNIEQVTGVEYVVPLVLIPPINEAPDGTEFRLWTTTHLRLDDKIITE